MFLKIQPIGCVLAAGISIGAQTFVPSALSAEPLNKTGEPTGISKPDMNAPARIPANAPFAIGIKGPQVALLREHLRAGGLDRHAAVDADVYDLGLVADIRAFQAGHGLKSTGLPGPATIAMLNGDPIPQTAKASVNINKHALAAKNATTILPRTASELKSAKSMDQDAVMIGVPWGIMRRLVANDIAQQKRHPAVGRSAAKQPDGNLPLPGRSAERVQEAM